MSDASPAPPGLDGQMVVCLNCGAEQRLEFSLCTVCGCRLVAPQAREASTRGTRGRLARQKWIGIGTAVAIVVAGAGIGWRTWQRATAQPPFQGVETEDNNQSSQANDVPFGSPVTGHIGKRIDRERSDRDFYRIVVPRGTSVISIRTTALPNMALCTLLFKDGDEEASARFCPGRPGEDLVVPVPERAGYVAGPRPKSCCAPQVVGCRSSSTVVHSGPPP